MSAAKRPDWMTEELALQLQQLACGGCLSCEQVQAFAHAHAIDITQMKPFVDAMGLTVVNCRGLCSAAAEPAD